MIYIYNMSDYTFLQVLRQDFNKHYMYRHISHLKRILFRLRQTHMENYSDTDIRNKLNQVIACINDLNFTEPLSSSDLTTIQTTLKTTIDRFNSFLFTKAIDDNISVNDIVSHLDELIATFNGLQFKVIPISPLI